MKQEQLQLKVDKLSKELKDLETKLLPHLEKEWLERNKQLVGKFYKYERDNSKTYIKIIDAETIWISCLQVFFMKGMSSLNIHKYTYEGLTYYEQISETEFLIAYFKLIKMFKVS